ncbi:YciI family protein [Geodermatophilus sp. YIM 151500]|uniref:YciI family protein n=1 Tax=Geodermatophilus sp. YIM 151500 TaxID=2984531 RepID=UPI0021E36523|nr:YciI family protein [Geodermatophilus sp. YIM 151500]MCV2491930.1 YciI family protein [Geodermatophilus sp. YIM 151500]
MPQYLLNLIQPVGEVPPPEQLDPIVRDVTAVSEEMRAAGVWVFAAGLHQPEASTVVRPRGDDVLVTDGPYAEGKEFVGGFTLIRVDDLDAALDWGRRLARASTLPVEVRPVADAAL